jgi:polyhydroxybutyrate depolymerase
MPAYSGLDDLAREQNCVLAYPASLENHWPLSFGPKLAQELSFFDALVNHLVRGMSLDSRRIYLTGMSNGGYFANVIASRRGRFIAGLGIHSGSAGVLALGRVNSPRKFPVFIHHGDADGILPVQNGRDQAAYYRREGHPVQYEEIAGMGHIWAIDPSAANARMWRFWTENAAA